MTMAFIEQINECYIGNGAGYSGHVHRTEKGELCQNWKETEVHIFTLTLIANPFLYIWKGYG